MARPIESEQAIQINQQIEMEVTSELEPRAEVLGKIDASQGKSLAGPDHIMVRRGIPT